MGTNKEQIAELYYRSNSVQFGAFALSIHQDNPSLPLSPYYLHFPKQGEVGSELLPELYDLIGQEFLSICDSQMPPLKPRRIAGVPRGAMPLADAHAQLYSDYPANVVVFSKTMQAGRTTFSGPEGNFNEGDELVIDDDHTSGGRNKKLMYAAAISGGLVVANMLTVVDRMQGGVENMAQVGVRLHSIFTIDELLQAGADIGFITQRQVDESVEYRLLNQY